MDPARRAEQLRAAAHERQAMHGRGLTTGRDATFSKSEDPHALLALERYGE